MTGRKQQIESKVERRNLDVPQRNLKAGSSEVLMQDFDISKIKSPRDAASGQAKS